MHTIVGSCPKCGAPIYSPGIWHGINPPPVSYTCVCGPGASTALPQVVTVPYQPSVTLPTVPWEPPPTAEDTKQKVMDAVQRKLYKALIDRVEEIAQKQAELEKMLKAVLELAYEQIPNAKQNLNKREPSCSDRGCAKCVAKKNDEGEKGILHHIGVQNKTILHD